MSFEFKKSDQCLFKHLRGNINALKVNHVLLEQGFKSATGTGLLRMSDFETREKTGRKHPISMVGQEFEPGLCA